MPEVSVESVHFERLSLMIAVPVPFNRTRPIRHIKLAVD